MRKAILLILLAVVFVSCYSYKIFPKGDREFVYNGEKKKAFVVNPQLSKEFHILKKAGIFQFTSDSLDESTVRIKLSSMKRNFACGEPIIASVLTLGQLPVLFPDRYDYSFEEIGKSDTIRKNFELHVATRFWFWDMFVFNKNFDRKAGKALLACYYDQ